MQQILFDDHVHSHFSCDGHDSVLCLCQAALDQGLGGLSLTDHFDTDPADYGYGRYDYEAIQRAVEEARGAHRGRLAILLGAEVCFQPVFRRRIEDFLGACPLDFVLGSVHYVRREFVDRSYFARHGAEEGYRLYLAAVEEAVASGLFDSLGHLDYAKRYAREICGPFDPTPHWPQIERILRLLVEQGTALEINAGGWRRALAEPFPGEAIVRRYRELGGERITLGCDSHCAADLGRDVVRAAELARSVGFTHLMRFVGRQAVSIPY